MITPRPALPPPPASNAAAAASDAEGRLLVPPLLPLLLPLRVFLILTAVPASMLPEVGVVLPKMVTRLALLAVHGAAATGEGVFGSVVIVVPEAAAELVEKFLSNDPRRERSGRARACAGGGRVVLILALTLMAMHGLVDKPWTSHPYKPWTEHAGFSPPGQGGAETHEPINAKEENSSVRIACTLCVQKLPSRLYSLAYWQNTQVEGWKGRTHSTQRNTLLETRPSSCSVFKLWRQDDGGVIQ